MHAMMRANAKTDRLPRPSLCETNQSVAVRYVFGSDAASPFGHGFLTWSHDEQASRRDVFIPFNTLQFVLHTPSRPSAAG